MARDLESGSSQYLEYAGAVLSVEPISVSAWIKPESAAAATAVFSLGVNGGVARHTLVYTATSLIQASSTNSGGSGGQSNSSGTAAVGSWSQVGAIFGSSTSRKAVLQGTVASANTTSLTISGLNRTVIGARYNTTLGAYFDGVIAEVGVWNVELLDADWAALADGVSPILVRPDALVAYWPLMGRSSPEVDLMGGAPMTVTGAAQAAHPPMRYPGRVHVVKAPATGGATYTLTAAQGSFTLTGQAAGLTASRLLTAAQGSFALTGQAATLKAARLITAAQGSYTLTGQDATLTYTGAATYTLTAAQGAFTLTGRAAGLTAARVLTAAQGTYSLTGIAAGLSVGSGLLRGRPMRRSRRPIWVIEGSKKKCLRRRCERSGNISPRLRPLPTLFRSSERSAMLWN